MRTPIVLLLDTGRDTLDPAGTVPEEGWEEFTNRYLRAAEWLSERELPLAQPHARKSHSGRERVVCPCEGENCEHQALVPWATLKRFEASRKARDRIARNA